jgi:opacity protein-like surface antigen
MRNRFAVAILGLVLVCGAGTMSAQDEWSYEIEGGLWFAGADGYATVNAPDGPMRLEFDDYWRFETGFFAGLQAQRGKWGYLVDWSQNRVPIDDRDISLQFLTGGATYRLSEGETAVNLVFGARYVSGRAGVRVEVEDPDEDADDDERYMRAGGSTGWMDAVVGIQVLRPVGERWTLDAYVDVGGGQGLSYQAAVGASFRATSSVSVKGGYRLMSGDDETDSIDFDAFFGGIYIGLGYQF